MSIYSVTTGTICAWRDGHSECMPFYQCLEALSLPYELPPSSNFFHYVEGVKLNTNNVTIFRNQICDLFRSN